MVSFFQNSHLFELQTVSFIVHSNSFAHIAEYLEMGIKAYGINLMIITITSYKTSTCFVHLATSFLCYVFM
uniref:Uncharacterized protein n=1 Tax=Noccaea caerulescens TaxID=107243 RepID=A0A1J3GU69_NOCCA